MKDICVTEGIGIQSSLYMAYFKQVNPLKKLIMYWNIC